MTYLPVAVHLVSETPKLYVVRLFNAVLNSQIAVIRTAFMVAVFDKISCFLGTSQAEIYSHHTGCVGFFAPFHKFVGAEAVRLCNAPCELKTFRSFLDRTNTVLPIISRNKVAAGIAYNRNVKLANLVDNVLTEAVLVSGCVRGFINSAVNCSAEMLNKRAVNSRVDFSYLEFVYYG